MTVTQQGTRFPTTRWTFIAQLIEPATKQSALERICTNYRKPVYAFLRRSGKGHEEAEDITQEFLVMVLRQGLFERADREAGRLRSWLLRALEYFLGNQRRFNHALKRNGGRLNLSLEDRSAPLEINRLASEAATPAEAFDRAWLGALVEQTAAGLMESYRSIGRETVFTALLPWLMGEGNPAAQQSAAVSCGLTLTNFRVQLHRLRGRFRDELRRRIAETVGSEEEVQEELTHLFRIAGRSV